MILNLIISTFVFRADSHKSAALDHEKRTMKWHHQKDTLGYVKRKKEKNEH